MTKVNTQVASNRVTNMRGCETLVYLAEAASNARASDFNSMLPVFHAKRTLLSV
jgi:hypothetical protein